MSEMTTRPTFQQVWKQMDVPRRTSAALALVRSNTQARARMLAELEARIHMRRSTLMKLPEERVAALLSNYGVLGEDLSTLLIRSYFFGSHRPMLSAFLDALQIPHKEGEIEDNTEVPLVAEEPLRAAVEKIRAEYPAEDVDLYLKALLASGPETWGNVAQIVPEESSK